MTLIEMLQDPRWLWTLDDKLINIDQVRTIEPDEDTIRVTWQDGSVDLFGLPSD